VSKNTKIIDERMEFLFILKTPYIVVLKLQLKFSSKNII